MDQTKFNPDPACIIRPHIIISYEKQQVIFNYFSVYCYCAFFDKDFINLPIDDQLYLCKKINPYVINRQSIIESIKILAEGGYIKKIDNQWIFTLSDKEFKDTYLFLFCLFEIYKIIP